MSRYCYQNSYPQAVSTVTVTQQTITIDDADLDFREEVVLASAMDVSAAGVYSFVLTYYPYSAGSVFVAYNGVAQRQGASYDYIVTGQTVTLNFTPAVGSAVLVKYPTIATAAADNSYKTATVSAVGPNTNVDVSDGVSVVFVDTSANNVTISGFVGGVAGQHIQVIKTNSSNSLIFFHAAGTGNQDIYTTLAAPMSFVGGTFGGLTLACNGSDWYEVD